MNWSFDITIQQTPINCVFGRMNEMFDMRLEQRIRWNDGS